MNDRSSPPGLRTLGDIPRLHARQRPDAEALRCGARVTTWRTLDSYSNRIANGLLALRVDRESRVAYLGKNSDHLIAVLLGTAKAGGVFFPINWRLAAPECAYVLQDSGARLIFVASDFLHIVDRLPADLRKTLQVIVADRSVESHLDLPTWLADLSDSDPVAAADPDDTALQIYTSGTTGRPKGAEISHRALLAGVAAALALPEPAYVFAADEAAHIWGPLFHIGGQIFWIIAAAQGAMLIITETFEPGEALRLINDFRVPVMSMVPATLQTVLDHPTARSTNFSRVRYLLYGGAPMPPLVVKHAMTYMAARFLHVYGMTECIFVSCLLPVNHDPRGNQRMLSVGRPYPGVELKVLSTDGRELPPGEAGEVTVRAAHMMTGYWHLDEATAQTIDENGWLRTGDGGYLDADGYLFLKDRIKDMIISGGENIYPAEIEVVLYGHPAVKEVAVIAVPDEKWGEVPKAYVVLAPGASMDAQALRDYCGEHLARYKLPRYFEAVEALPRSSVGKILKGELRQHGRERGAAERTTV